MPVLSIVEELSAATVWCGNLSDECVGIEEDLSTEMKTLADVENVTARLANDHSA